MERIVCPAKTGSAGSNDPSRRDATGALARYDDNANGRITCYG